MRGRYGFAVLTAVIGFSIVLGMVLGGRFDAPPSAVAANSGNGALRVDREGVPAAKPGVDFSEIVARSIPAVVSVSNTRSQTPPVSGRGSDDLFRFFFGEPDTQRERPRQPRRDVSSGSGFLITPDGYILTNHHVVDGAAKLEVTLDDGAGFVAEVIGTDPIIDLALIRIDAGDRVLPTLPLGDSDALKVGEWVIAIGNPLELSHTVTVGVVSAKGRNVSVGSTFGPLARFIQTDAAINFGNSGGPLLDASGRVIGINSAILRNGGPFNSPLIEGIGFALPINVAWDAARQIRETGVVRRGFLGVTMNPDPIDDRAREYYGLPDTNGVLIQQVTPGGPADKGRVVAGDIIRKVDGEVVRDNEDLLTKVAGKRPGETARLEIFRKGKTVETDVVLAVRPTDPTRLDVPLEVPEPESEEPVPRSLGLRVGPIADAMRRHAGIAESTTGVMILEVDPDSDAAERGLAPGMIVQSVNDRRVDDPPAWQEATRDVDPGEIVKLGLRGPGDATRSVFVRAPERSER